MMKALLIGGTGNISLEITKLLAAEGEWELYLLNRGSHNAELPAGVHCIRGDIRQEAEMARVLEGMQFDVVANFINYTPDQIEQDIRLFTGKTKQYIFISSASAYQKPSASPIITEGTPLCNPFWQYSRDKIACEDVLWKAMREQGFPITIVRPSHTYSEKKIPVAIHGQMGSWQTVQRILDGKPIVVPGDGNSLWTMTHSRDFAKGFIGLMGNIHALGQAVHITSDESLTWNQIYDILGNALGKEVKKAHISTDMITMAAPSFAAPLLGDKANTVIFDNSKIKSLVPQFCAATRFDQGIRESVKYHFAHPEQQVLDAEFDRWCDAVIDAAREFGAIFEQKMKRNEIICK